MERVLHKIMMYKLGLIFCGIFLISTVSPLASGDIIRDRQLNFKLSKKSMKALREAIKTEDLSSAQKAVNFHVDWSGKLTSYFPPESGASMNNDSDASGDIWVDFERFRKLSLDYAQAATRLNSALVVSDFELASKNFFSMAKACKSCHETFRN